VGYPISYWRTASGLEVDFVLGDHEIALEVKAVEQVVSHHLRGLNAFVEEYRSKHTLVVSLDPRPRLMEDITILPWREFLDQLWGGLINYRPHSIDFPPAFVYPVSSLPASIFFSPFSSI
jgi:hypothetical protein